MTSFHQVFQFGVIGGQETEGHILIDLGVDAAQAEHQGGAVLGVGDDAQDDFQAAGFGHGRDADAVDGDPVLIEPGGVHDLLVGLAHFLVIYQPQVDPAHVGFVGQLG